MSSAPKPVYPWTRYAWNKAEKENCLRLLRERGLESVGQLIRRCRSEANMSEEGLARMVGVRKGYISDIERRKVRPPSWLVLLKLTRALKIDEKKLMILAHIEKAPEQIQADLIRALAPILREE